MASNQDSPRADLRMLYQLHDASIPWSPISVCFLTDAPTSLAFTYDCIPWARDSEPVIIAVGGSEHPVWNAPLSGPF